MKSSSFTLLFFLAIAVVVLFTSCANQPKLITQSEVDTTKPRYTQTPPTPVPGEYVVILKDNLGAPAIFISQRDTKDRLQRYKTSQPQRTENAKLIKDVMARNNIKESSVKYYYTDLLLGFCAKMSEQDVKLLRLDQHVKGVYQDLKVRYQQNQLGWQIFESRYFTDQYQYYVPRAVALAGGPIDGSNKDTWIWIIDSGIDLDHPDLNVETADPYAVSFVGGSPDDDFGHGTMVAGLAAAKNNGIGTCGVSAGAVVVPLKVGIVDALAGGYAPAASAVLAALDHVAQFGIVDDVVNLSIVIFRGDDCTTTINSLEGNIRTAVATLGWSGIWVCCGAGNDASCDGAAKNVPACSTAWRVFTIGATTMALTCADYSNWGTTVDWAACGTSFSTYLNGKYSTAEGTSLATPIVAGIIHATGKAPVSSGNVNCCLENYKIANASPLSNFTFDVDLELTRIDIQNVRDLDGTEDLFGRIDLKKMIILSDTFNHLQNLWLTVQRNAIHTGNGTVNVNKRISLASNISFDQLRNIELDIRADIEDDEGNLGYHARVFKCQECKFFNDNYGTLHLPFIGLPSTLASINSLPLEFLPTALKFGSDNFFEMNYYEDNDQNHGWAKLLFKVFVTTRGTVNSACSSCHAHTL